MTVGYIFVKVIGFSTFCHAMTPTSEAGPFLAIQFSLPQACDSLRLLAFVEIYHFTQFYIYLQKLILCSMHYITYVHIFITWFEYFFTLNILYIQCGHNIQPQREYSWYKITKRFIQAVQYQFYNIFEWVNAFGGLLLVTIDGFRIRTSYIKCIRLMRYKFCAAGSKIDGYSYIFYGPINTARLKFKFNAHAILDH